MIEFNSLRVLKRTNLFCTRTDTGPGHGHAESGEAEGRAAGPCGGGHNCLTCTSLA